MPVVELLVFITCFCLAQDFVSCDDYGESGNDITLTPSIRGKPLDILWRHNGSKVLEYDGSTVVKYGLFEDRVDVDFETGQLIIRKLNIQDSGKYQSEILINGIVQTSSHSLTVLDALPEPRVTCEVGENSNMKNLSCSVESQTQPSYEWSGPGIKQPGPTLLVNEQEEKHDSVYTCTVKNKAGIKTTDFNLQDCHTGGVSLAVLVPVLIVAVLFIILLAVLALYLYRRKKQKSGKSELKKMHSENGECDDLLINVSPEVIPGSSDATLPCHIRLTAPKESIADKKWDQDSESENAGETHERQKLLQESPQSAITEKNKEVTRNTNERELGKNEKNGKNADDAEENANSKPDETAIEVESPKSLQTQEENEKSQILKNESEDKEESPEKQIEPLGEQETKDADKNEEDQTPGEIKEKEEENKDIDSPNTETESPQSAVTERNKMDKGYVAEQLHNNEKNSQNENDEQSHEEQNKSLSTDINEDDQRPEDEKEVEVKTEEEIYRPLTESPANLEKEPINSSVPSSDQTALNYTDQDKRQTDINMENKLPGEEQNEKEKVLTPEELKGSQEQMAEENKHDTVLSEPQISIHSDKQGKQIDPDSTINSVSQQQCHNDWLSKEDGISCEAVPAYSEKLSNTDKKQDNEVFDNDAEITQNEEQTEVESEKDDESEQRDKSSESEQSMENDVPEIKETKNKHLKDCDVKNSNPDNTNTDIYVPEDKKAKTETDSFLKHAMKEDHSAEIREQDLNKQSCTECDNTVYSEEGKMGSVLSAVKEEEKICQLEPREGSSVS